MLLASYAQNFHDDNLDLFNSLEWAQPLWKWLQNANLLQMFRWAISIANMNYRDIIYKQIVRFVFGSGGRKQIVKSE